VVMFAAKVRNGKLMGKARRFIMNILNFPLPLICKICKVLNLAFGGSSSKVTDIFRTTRTQ